MKHKLTVTIGITAYNEEHTIGLLLQSLVKQKYHSYTLEKIYLICDGCTDNTKGEAEQYVDRLSKLSIINKPRRKGQAARLNQLMQRTHSDVLVLIDADSVLAKTDTIESIVTYFHDNNQVGLVCGNAQPYPPLTFIESAVYVSFKVYEGIRSEIHQGNNIFAVKGCFIALSKALYSRADFPQTVTASDIYLYLLNKRKGFEFRFASDALAYYQLPTTIHDHIQQNSRFINSAEEMVPYFGMDVEKEFFIPRRLWLRHVLNAVIRKPIASAVIFVLNSYCRIRIKAGYQRTAVWESVGSTKNGALTRMNAWEDSMLLASNSGRPYDRYRKLPVIDLTLKIKNLGLRHGNGVIIVNFGAYNSGEEAILAGEIAELRRIPGMKLTVLARFPEAVQNLHHVNAVNIKHILPVVSCVLHADFIVLGGGGMFSRNHHGVKDALLQWYLLALCTFAHIFRKPFYVIGITISKHLSVSFMRAIKYLFTNARLVTVRDFDSYDILRTLSVPVKVYKDNSYLLSVESKNRIMEDSLIRTQYLPSSRHMGLTLTYVPAYRNIIIRETVRLISKYNQSIDFWFFALDQHPGFRNDQYLNEMIIKKLFNNGITRGIHVLHNNWHPAKVFAMFKLMDFMVAIRLHGSIFSYRLKVPFIGYSYGEKCDAFLTSVGRKPMTLDAFQAQIISNAFESDFLGKKPFSTQANQHQMLAIHTLNNVTNVIYSKHAKSQKISRSEALLVSDEVNSRCNEITSA